MYRGVQVLNHAQIDRWNILASLNYLPQDEEVSMVLDQVTNLKGVSKFNRCNGVIS